MKRHRLIFILIASTLWMNCFAACKSGAKKVNNAKVETVVCNDWIHPDKVAYQELGQKLTDILINAKTINVYTLVPKEKINSDDYEVDANFVRDSLLCKLTKEQATVLAYNLISNGANYHKDSSLIVMSPYYPILEFEYVKKKEAAHVIISPSNYSWSIKYEDKILFRYNYASGAFIKRFCEYFINKEKGTKR